MRILVYYHMVKQTVNTNKYKDSQHTKHSHNAQHVNTHATHVKLFCHRCITVYAKPQCEAGTMSPKPNRLEDWDAEFVCCNTEQLSVDIILYMCIIHMLWLWVLLCDTCFVQPFPANGSGVQSQAVLLMMTQHTSANHSPQAKCINFQSTSIFMSWCAIPHVFCMTEALT